MKPKLKKSLLTAFKILISICLLAVVFYQINWQQLKEVLVKVNYYYLLVCVLFFILSQAVSVLRLDLFFRVLNINMSFITHSKFYVLGMFYNFFIPGGIGGDAYKIYVLNKTYKTSIRQLTQAIFLDRLMGLLAIFLLLSILLLRLLPIFNYWKWITLAIVLLLSFISIIVLKKIFPKQRKNYYLAFFYAVIIQSLQVYSIIYILKSLGNTEENISYIVLFLVSSIMSIFSFAGIGVREYIFYYGGQWFNFNEGLSVATALLFSIVTAFVSLFGVIFLFKKINLIKS